MACIRSAFSFDFSWTSNDSPRAPEPLDRALARDAAACSLRDRVPLLAEHLQAREIGIVAQTPCCVLERELADLAIDPRLIDLDGLAARPEGGKDRGDGAVVQGDAGDLGKHGSLPGLVAETGLPAPRLARIGVELAVAAIGEVPIVSEP